MEKTFANYNGIFYTKIDPQTAKNTQEGTKTAIGAMVTGANLIGADVTVSNNDAGECIIQTPPGTDSFNWLATGQSIQLRLFVIHEMAKVLEKLHASGIVHRDFKLENIIVLTDDEGEFFALLVIDYEYALVPTVKAKIDETANCGTPSTAAPEVNTGKYNAAYAQSTHNQRTEKAKPTDVFSFGVTVFMLYVGMNLFSKHKLSLYYRAWQAKLLVKCIQELVNNVKTIERDSTFNIDEFVSGIIDEPTLEECTRNCDAITQKLKREFPDADFEIDPLECVHASIKSLVQCIMQATELDSVIKILHILQNTLNPEPSLRWTAAQCLSCIQGEGKVVDEAEAKPTPSRKRGKRKRGGCVWREKPLCQCSCEEDSYTCKQAPPKSHWIESA